MSDNRISRVAFVGSKRLGLAVLKELNAVAPNSVHTAITVDDSADSRSNLSEFKAYCESVDQELVVLARNKELPTVIERVKPELCIVVGWYWILSKALLEMVPEGWAGIHASLLPRYRGGAPLVWSLINGDSEAGASLFYFTEGMDEGDIISQKRFPVETSDTIADLLTKAESASVEMITETYPLLLKGTAPRIKQDHSQATFAALRKPEDGRIDWNSNAQRIYNFIRAQTHPYPGAFSSRSSGEVVRFWGAKIFPSPCHGTPGQVVFFQDGGAVICCGEDTAIFVNEVQIDSNLPANATSALRFGEHLACLPHKHVILRS